MSLGERPQSLQIFRPLRVNQLDASELDGEITDIILAKVQDVFKYAQMTLLDTIRPEVNALVGLVLWKYTVYDTGATVGQTLLDMTYRTVGRPAPLSRTAKILYGMVCWGLPYLSQRIGHLACAAAGSESLTALVAEAVVSWGKKLCAVASLMSFVVFLQRGRQQHVVERVLGIQALHNGPQTIREIGYDYTDREQMWHAFSELLVFLLPLLSSGPIARFFRRGSTRIDPKTSHLCPICNQWPTNTSVFSGCKHVFCYYCIKSTVDVEGKYECSGCLALCDKTVPIEPYRKTIS